MKPKDTPLIAIVGETASGKSSLAIKLAKRFNGEIICADSMTIYKGFDIGTSKPTSDDRLEIPHHLLDIANPLSGFNAKKFQTLATNTIEDIKERHKQSILVGGSGLYINSVLFNYKFLPPPSTKYRHQLNQLNLSELLQKIENLGLSTDLIDINNKRRVIRLIETNGFLPPKSPLRPQTIIIGLQAPKVTLKSNIVRRVNKILAAGLEEEVSHLVSLYGWDIEPMKSVGYREWRDYFEGSNTYPELRNKIIQDTLNLAKKQRVWFRRNKSIQWFSTGYNFEDIVDLVTTFLNN